MIDFSEVDTNSLKDYLTDWKMQLWAIDYDWHNHAPILRQNIVLAEQELTRRARQD